MSWYTTPDFSEDSLFDFNTMRVSESLQLYAKWNAFSYQISYDLNGGVWPADYEKSYRESIKFDDKIYYLPTRVALRPTHKDYGLFLGWRKISQADYVNLTDLEKEKYPYVTTITPKEGMEEEYPDFKIELYAQYRNFK